MSDPLPALESQRTIIQRQISKLGDLRAGSVTTTGGRCGNPRCHCHEQDDPGHGPFYRLTRKIGGKTVTETFSTPAALRKAQHEVAEYHRFREPPSPTASRHGGRSPRGFPRRLSRPRPSPDSPIAA